MGYDGKYAEPPGPAPEGMFWCSKCEKYVPLADMRKHD